MPSPGASTWRPWSATARAGTTCTTPAANSDLRAASPPMTTVHLFGIRHHGPGSARSVRRALDAVQPTAVLVELPADVQPALAWMGRPGLVPPVALLGIARPAGPGAPALCRVQPRVQPASGRCSTDTVTAIDCPCATRPAAEGRVGWRWPSTRWATRWRLAGRLATDERWWRTFGACGEGVEAFAAVAAAMTRCPAHGGHLGEDRREGAHARRCGTRLPGISRSHGVRGLPCLRPAPLLPLRWTRRGGLPKVKVGVIGAVDAPSPGVRHRYGGVRSLGGARVFRHRGRTAWRGGSQAARRLRRRGCLLRRTISLLRHGARRRCKPAPPAWPRCWARRAR